MIENLIKSLRLPENEILFLHVRLKGMNDELEYRERSEKIIYYLDQFYQPKSVLVPSFTYSFTKSGLYDRTRTPGEVGRFSEEIRQIYSFEKRTMNPVFNVVDVKGFCSALQLNEETAFGAGSLFETLSKTGYIILNINLNVLINTHLHYLEYVNKVSYRYQKTFKGKVSSDGTDFREISYDYYVRNQQMDTAWRREKIKSCFAERQALFEYCINGVCANWIHSKKMDEIIRQELSVNEKFLITD